MLKKIKNYIAQFKQKNQKKKELVKAQKYYQMLQSGALFLKFIEQDLNHMKKQQMNRQQRRRFEKSLYEKGKFSQEMILHYSTKIDSILNFIESQANKSKQKSVKSITSSVKKKEN
jgi:hypothetical protein